MNEHLFGDKICSSNALASMTKKELIWLLQAAENNYSILLQAYKAQRKSDDILRKNKG